MVQFCMFVAIELPEPPEPPVTGSDPVNINVLNLSGALGTPVYAKPPNVQV